jgi:hypothetical protein
MMRNLLRSFNIALILTAVDSTNSERICIVGLTALTEETFYYLPLSRHVHNVGPSASQLSS